MSVVREGLLLKKGEFIQTWRPRWFVLRADGSFRGYKQKPVEGDNEVPINVFDVQRSDITTLNPKDEKNIKKGEKYGFSVRFMQLTRIIERSFHTETKEDRDAWVAAYQDVRQKLDRDGAAGSIIERTRAMSFIDPKRPQPCDISLTDFDLLKVLGKGTFGKVMLVRQKSTSSVFAMKVLKKDVVLEKGELVHTLTENSVLAKCSHPFLTSLKYSFQTPDHLFFVMEYVNGGELFMHLRKSKVFSEERVRFYGAEITLAITYLHDSGIVYRDLKLENILLDQEGHIKITDFGLSKEEMTFGATTTTFCGTPEYLAPEVLEDSEYGRAVDWWGLGVIMFEMMTSKLPFTAPPGDWDRLFHNVLTQDVVYPPTLSPLATDLLSKLIVKNPQHRLGGGPRDGLEVLEHPFFASLDLQRLKQRDVAPPFVPVVTSDTDVSNFDPYFTREAVRLTPPDQSGFSRDEKEESFENFESVAK